MALETLKGIEYIAGHKVSRVRNFGIVHEKIEIDQENGVISFKIQNGPIKENGVNGCQVDAIIETARLIISGLDDKMPCKENKTALLYLDAAIHELNIRTADRVARGVEGTSRE